MPEFSPEFEALLACLQQDYHCDLYGYKPSTLERRFNHRMSRLKISRYAHYLNYLRSHPEEPKALLDDVFINYTHFFRDTDFWHYLATHLIPQVIAHQRPDDMIRVWSSGCAKGQEIVSVLILLAEAIGLGACLQRVKCFATDVDQDILQKAASGIYTHHDLETIPSELLDKYFKYTEKGYIFNPDLRRRIIFGRHDLVKNPPISNIDLVLCRNVLIYFKSDIQKMILNRFYFALKETGFLALGKAEAIVNLNHFKTVNLKQRIYGKGAPLSLADLLTLVPKSPAG